MLFAVPAITSRSGLLLIQVAAYPPADADMGWPETATRSCPGAAPARARVHPAHCRHALLLVKRTDGRPPGYDRENDCDVVLRGRKVGRIWKYDYTGKVRGEMAHWLWHWDWRDVDGRKDAESLEAAMFRAAWDAPAGNVRTITPR